MSAGAIVVVVILVVLFIVTLAKSITIIHQAEKGLFPLWILEIDGQRALAAVVGVEVDAQSQLLVEQKGTTRIG